MNLPTEFEFLAKRKLELQAELQAIEDLELNISKTREVVARLDEQMGRFSASEWQDTVTHELVQYLLANKGPIR